MMICAFSSELQNRAEKAMHTISSIICTLLDGNNSSDTILEY